MAAVAAAVVAANSVSADTEAGPEAAPSKAMGSLMAAAQRAKTSSQKVSEQATAEVNFNRLTSEDSDARAKIKGHVKALSLARRPSTALPVSTTQDLPKAPELSESLPLPPASTADAAAEKGKSSLMKSLALAPSALIPVSSLKLQRRKCLIDPRQARWMPYWDGVTTLALLFIALVTPFEVAFLPPANSLTAPLFLVNRLLDVVFIIDLFLNFCVMQPVTDADLGMRWLDTSSAVVRHYLLSWFTLDVASILVSAFDIIPVVVSTMAEAGSGEEGGLSALQSLTPLRLLRALRLIKLLRLSKVARIMKRWETELALDYSTIDLIKILVLVILAAHWSACAWGLPVAPLFVEDPTGTWLERLMYCVSAEHVDAESGLPTFFEVPDGTWGSSTYEASRGPMLCVAPAQVYLHCLYWGFLMVSGGAEPEMGMHSSATAEQATYILVLLFTQGINAIVLGTFTTVLLTGSPGKIAFQTNMDALNRFMASQGARINKPMRRRLREYFHQSRHLQVAATNADLLQNLSPGLQAELAWKTNKRWVHRVAFLQGTELSFMVEVALHLAPAVYAPGERPTNDKLYIIHRGIALYGGRMLISGKVWGEDMLLSSAFLRSPYVCTAMNYLEVFMLAEAQVHELVEAYPESKKRIRMVVCFMAFRRMIIYLAKAELGLPQSALLCSRFSGESAIRDGEAPLDEQREISPGAWSGGGFMGGLQSIGGAKTKRRPLAAAPAPSPAVSKAPKALPPIETLPPSRTRMSPLAGVSLNAPQVAPSPQPSPSKTPSGVKVEEPPTGSDS